MSRQHAAPILVPSTGPTLSLEPVNLRSTGQASFSEAQLQELVHAHPDCLPINEIDPVFTNAVAVCRELITPAGPIDNLLITPAGLPIIVECKLWRNPEGRREVVGQILDYAKELSRWSSSDLQREVARKVDGSGNPLLRALAAAGHVVDEIEFNDALTLHLRRGRYLLLIIGDGIREGVETIASYLQGHLGLHFSLGLVEMPIFRLPDGAHIVTPRVLAKTSLITRTVIALPEGHGLDEEDPQNGDDVERQVLSSEQQQFWAEFLDGLELDDPEQPIPKPPKLGYVSFMLPAPEGSSWINVWRDVNRGQVGLTLSWARGYVGEGAGLAVLEDWEEVSGQLGGSAAIVDIRGRRTIGEMLQAGDLTQPAVRASAFPWLRERLNAWINVLRPRIRSGAMDIKAPGAD